MADHTRVTHVRTGLAVLLACALLGGVPAAAHASLGTRALFHVATDTDPNDVGFPGQWSLENSGRFYTGAMTDADIDAEEAWQAPDNADGDGITVGVVDMGIYRDHPDLAGQFVDAPGPDYAPATTCEKPPPDHGTAIAGVIAALRGNGTGIAGIAPKAKILPVRALDDCGVGTPDSVTKGLRYAADNGAQIVVGSFSSDPWLDAASKAAIAQSFHDIFAQHPSTLFVFAAGNEGNNDDARPVYPCNSDAGNVLCVGASNVDDSPRCTSNYGNRSVDLFAPGDRIWTTVRPDAITPLSGTSMAAPIVAGVAALVWPTLEKQTAANVAAVVGNAVDPRDAMKPLSVSGGRLNAAVALGQTPADSLGAAQGTPCADTDHDGVNDVADDCPDTPGDGPQGCPLDTDSDGVPDASDNCPSVANPRQDDADGDRIGDACDATPRGADADGDGVGALDDRCPAQYARTSNGCPAAAVTPAPTPPPAVVTPPPVVVQPVVAPRIVSIAVRVAHNRRSARVTVRLSGTLRAVMRVERRVRRGHRHVWKRVLQRSLTFTARGRAMTVRTRARGSYRVTVSLAGARTVRRGFRV